MEFPYQDILALPHHVSQRHPPMPLRDRAAQFAPFSALTGYESLLAETARPTEARRELSESARALLDMRLQALLAQVAETPVVEVEHFVADATKTGGRYVRTSGRLAGVSPDGGRLVLAGGAAIAFADIVALESDALGKFESTW